jgi:hypothetical protein
MTARGSSGVIPMINKERDELRRALAQRETAESALESARAATNRARDLVEDLTRQLEDAAADAARVSWAAQDRLKVALRSGASPGDFVEERRSVGGDVAAKLEAARLVVADFKAEENDCEKALSDAKEAVERAVQDILRVEVEAIAAQWAEADLEARRLRTRLGVQGDPVWAAAGKSEAGRRATSKNFQDSDFGLQEQQAARVPWLEFSRELLSDPDARLEFTGADLAIEGMLKERADRREAEERFVARLRSGVAA